MAEPIRPGVAEARAGRSGEHSATFLDPPPGSGSERLGRRFSDHSPALVFILTIVVGYVLLVAAAIAVGFLLVDVLLPVHAIGHSDEAVNDWLASHRSASGNDVTFYGSAVGDIPFIPALVILTALAAAIMRRWRVAAFIVGAILIEVVTYRLTSLIVHRERPDVPRLDHLPVNQSYPSGHVAASVVVYVGLTLLITSLLRGRRAVRLVWIAAILLPLIVAFSRMYRGMHHPIDATAGVLIGIASVSIALFATRAAVESARLRDGTSTR
jgi:membrane-associated phospholipid phosphatase